MTPGILKQSTFQCIHYVEESEVSKFRDAASELIVREFSAARIRSDQDLFAAIHVAFEFPDYFGFNWDALDECLADLEWLPGQGYVLFITGAVSFWRRQPRLAARLVDVWLAAAEQWSQHQIPFHLVFVW